MTSNLSTLITEANELLALQKHIVENGYYISQQTAHRIADCIEKLRDALLRQSQPQGNEAVAVVGIAHTLPGVSIAGSWPASKEKVAHLLRQDLPEGTPLYLHPPTTEQAGGDVPVGYVSEHIVDMLERNHTQEIKAVPHDQWTTPVYLRSTPSTHPQEVSAVEKDAARYRWLRDKPGADSADGYGLLVVTDRPAGVPRYRGPIIGELLDVSIDAALTAGGQGKP